MVPFSRRSIGDPVLSRDRHELIPEGFGSPSLARTIPREDWITHLALRAM
jgi:hypothetical protein